MAEPEWYYEIPSYSRRLFKPLLETLFRKPVDVRITKFIRRKDKKKHFVVTINLKEKEIVPIGSNFFRAIEQIARDNGFCVSVELGRNTIFLEFEEREECRIEPKIEFLTPERFVPLYLREKPIIISKEQYKELKKRIEELKKKFGGQV